MPSGVAASASVPSSSSSGACIPPPLLGAASHRPQSHALNTPRAVGVGVAVLLALVVLVSVVATRHAANPSVMVVDPSTQLQHQLPPPPPARMLARDELDALRAQMDQLQYELAELRRRRGDEPVWPFDYSADEGNLPTGQIVARRHMAWQPMRRRRIAWQPMKREQQRQTPIGYGGGGGTQGLMYGGRDDDDDERKEHLMRTVENELAEVLRAGDRLGISPEHILAHLRARNNGGGGGMSPR